MLWVADGRPAALEYYWFSEQSPIESPPTDRIQPLPRLLGVSSSEEGKLGDNSWSILQADAQRHVLPMRLACRPSDSGFACDLLAPDGRTVVRTYESGPTEELALLAGEQRYLAEEVGGGTVPGNTYLDKARERIRRSRSSDT
jgi:hypothetical protein